MYMIVVSFILTLVVLGVAFGIAYIITAYKMAYPTAGDTLRVMSYTTGLPAVLILWAMWRDTLF